MSDNISIDGDSTTAEIKTTEVDDYCLEQVRTIANAEAFENPIKVMPDAHAGSGAVIGFTMELGDKVCPNTVGVDIGCGMTAGFFGGEPHAELDSIDESIRDTIPLGFHVHGDDGLPEQPYNMEADFPWEECADTLAEYDDTIESDYGPDYLRELCDRVGAEHD